MLLLSPPWDCIGNRRGVSYSAVSACLRRRPEAFTYFAVLNDPWLSG